MKNTTFDARQMNATLAGDMSQFMTVLPWQEYQPDATIPAFAEGDRVCVKEAWRVGAWHTGDQSVAVDYLADNHARKEWLGCNDYDMDSLIYQSRDDAKEAGMLIENRAFEYAWPVGESPCRIRSAYHMPQWASRLTIQITDVRVMRVRDIDRDAVNMRWFASWMASSENGDAWDRNDWIALNTFEVVERI